MEPLQGRVFADELERRVVVVSYGFWQQRLRSDIAAVGHDIEIDGLRYTVIGVMPQRFDYPSFIDVWAPWIPNNGEKRADRSSRSLNVLGRLAPGVSLRQARAEMSRIALEIAQAYPAQEKGRGIDVKPLTEDVDPYANRYVSIVAAAVLFLLVLACANVANIQLQRCAVRRREFALRTALGAGRTRIARQLLIEGVLLSLAGSVLGLPLAVLVLRLIKNSVPLMVMRHLPGLPYAGLDARMMLCAMATAVVTGIAFTPPAVLQTSTSCPYQALREGSRGTAGTGGGRMRSALVAGEVALAFDR